MAPGPSATTLPWLQHDDAVGDLVGLGQMMCGEKDCAALVPEVPHHPPEALARLHVHGGGRLVEEHDFGVACDRNGEADPLGLAARKAIGPPAEERADVRPLDDLVVGSRPTVEAPDQAEGLADPNTGGEADARARLEHRADSAVGHGLAWVGAENLDAAFLGTEESEQRRDRGRLAGAVRSEKCQHLALDHLQVQPVEGGPGPVAMGDVLEGKGGWSWPREGLRVGQCCYKGRQEVLRRLRPHSRCARSTSYNWQGRAGIRHMRIDEEVTSPAYGVLAGQSCSSRSVVGQLRSAVAAAVRRLGMVTSDQHPEATRPASVTQIEDDPGLDLALQDFVDRFVDLLETPGLSYNLRAPVCV